MKFKILYRKNNKPNKKAKAEDMFFLLSSFF